MNKKILLITYGGGHVKIIEKLYEKLKKNETYEVTILAFTSAKNYLEDKKIKVKSLYDYEFKTKLLYKLIPSYKKNEFISKEEHVLYNSLSIQELLEKYSEDITNELIKNYGKRVYLPVKTMKKVLQIEQPDLLITTNAPRMERAALIAARELGIVSVSIEDLFGEISIEDKKIDNYLGGDIYSKTYGDYVFVMNKYAKEKLILNGVQGKKIYITGNPNFEKSLSHKLSIENRKRNKVLYLSQQTNNFKMIFEKLLKISQKSEQLNFTIKLHPNQKIELNNKNIKEEYELEKAIADTDLIITEYSSAGLEGLVQGKKLIVIQLNEEHSKVIPFEKFYGVKILKTLTNLENEIVDFLNKTISDDKRKQFRYKVNSAYIMKKRIDRILLK